MLLFCAEERTRAGCATEREGLNPNVPTERINVNPVKGPYAVLWDEYREVSTSIDKRYPPNFGILLFTAVRV